MIKDVTVNDQDLHEMVNTKVAARELVVSDFDSLKHFTIGMGQKKRSRGLAEKAH